MRVVLLLTTMCLFAACSEQAPQYNFACDKVNPNLLSARFQVDRHDAKTDHGDEEKTITLWRKEMRVAHQYDDPAMTVAWARDAKGNLYSWQFFDEEQRAIEYEHRPGDPAEWQEKWQVVSQLLIDSMKPKSSGGEGCNAVTVYELNDGERAMELHWLDALQLPASFTVKNAGTVQRWTLQQINTETTAIDNLFASRDGYYSTDYADIGDNESDPFLLKMMNLGFIDHGSEGFYNSDGKKMGGHSH